MRSSKLMEKPVYDHGMIIDLEDEIEEEEWGPEPVSSTPTSGNAIREDEGLNLTSSQEKVLRMQVEGDAKEGLGLVGTASNPISSWPLFPKNIAKRLKDIPQEIGLVGSNQDKRDPFALGTDEGKCWQNVIDLDPSTKDTEDCSTIDVGMQQTDFIDLSTSESGDDGEDDIGDVAEEEEEIITTLSREDRALLAEVMKAIKEGSDLNKFKTDSLKTYLRHYGLRMTGLKAALLNRIQEHLKIKDGRAEVIYPRSSFSIDCTGDVCLGDTVLFQQTVYDAPFDILKRCASGPPLGQRCVAGKVVNESYGAGKQQHTFTIEVLWSIGKKPFYVMRPLLIKGRNLYRMKTWRQVWPNEAERKKVLDEKHARGEEARAIRRGAKSLKLKGKLKSREDPRKHPYLRSHITEPHNVPPMPPQNSVQYARTHTQDNVHQGSVPNPSFPARTHSMQYETYTERAVCQGFTKRYPAPEPVSPRGRNLHGQQNHHEGFTKRYPAPEPVSPRARNLHGQQNHHEGFTEIHPPLGPSAPRGRNFHSQQSRYEGRTQAHHVPPGIHAQESMQHGRIYTHRQVSDGGMDSQMPVHPNRGRQQGRMTIPCSNPGCDRLGAKHCISRSCGACCSRNSARGRGRCPRHQ